MDKPKYAISDNLKRQGNMRPQGENNLPEFNFKILKD